MTGPQPDQPPAEDASFAQRLVWLLRNVAAVPGRRARFSIETVTVVLGLADAEAHASRDVEVPDRAVLPLEEIDPSAPALRRQVSAMETLFRLPRGYFVDPEIRRATDERIMFIARTTGAGIQVIGPCRSTPPPTVGRRHRALARIVAGLGGMSDSA
jgi:hypothetical protein